MMQQCSLKAGLKEFCEEAVEAITKELTQIHDLETHVPVDLDKISKEERQLEMEPMIFLIK